MPQRKDCSKCGETKPLEEFHRSEARKDGRNPWCKDCVRGHSRRYREENRDKIAERNHRYREENRDKIAERKRRYYEENRDKVLDRSRRYYEENRDILKSYTGKIREDYQELSKSFATVPPGTPFIPGEDALLLADNGMTIYQKAVELGRTHASCRRRIGRIRAKMKTT